MVGVYKEMSLCIVIGSYGLPDFVQLNLAQCCKLWPSSPILVSDDLSPVSEKIREHARNYGASYMATGERSSHISGDFQVFLNAARFGQQTGLPVLKLSQRFVPARHEFAQRLAGELDGLVAVLPGQLSRNEIARPKANIYLRFGLLTDVALFNASIITPQILLNEYNVGLAMVGAGQHGSKIFTEIVWGRLRSSIPGIRTVDWLAKHVPMEPKLFLRKAGSNSIEYADLARSNGVSGEWDVREWSLIEGKQYKCIPFVT